MSFMKCLTHVSAQCYLLLFDLVGYLIDSSNSASPKLNSQCAVHTCAHPEFPVFLNRPPPLLLPMSETGSHLSHLCLFHSQYPTQPQVLTGLLSRYFSNFSTLLPLYTDTLVQATVISASDSGLLSGLSNSLGPLPFHSPSSILHPVGSQNTLKM